MTLSCVEDLSKTRGRIKTKFAFLNSLSKYMIDTVTTIQLLLHLQLKHFDLQLNNVWSKYSIVTGTTTKLLLDLQLKHLVLQLNTFWSKYSIVTGTTTQLLLDLHVQLKHLVL